MGVIPDRGMKQIESEYDNDAHCLSPWLILNMVFFVLIRVTHLFYMISDSKIISPLNTLSRRHMNEAELLAYLSLPKMIMVTAGLLFVVTLLGEIVDNGPLFSGKITPRTFCSISFSVLAMAYYMAAALHFYIIYPTVG